MKTGILLAAAGLIVIVLILALTLTGTEQQPSTTTTVQNQRLPYVNVTSVTIVFDNLTSIGSAGIPNYTEIGRTYQDMPHITVLAQGLNVSAGDNLTVNVSTAYTFNGQAIEFVPETPGFTVLNSTYLFSNEIYVNVTTSTTSASTSSTSSTSTSSYSTTSSSSTSTSSISSTSTTSAPVTSYTTTIQPTTTLSTTTTVSPDDTLIPAGSVVYYTVYLSTPADGYHGDLKLVEVINNVDRTGILISNSSS